MWKRLLFASCLTSCVEPNVVQCDDGTICPAQKVCDSIHHLCVPKEQLSSCTGKADQETCDFAPSSVCQQGTCLPVGCGNGRMDPGEVCDDGNQIAGDNCAADCSSNETCGNSTIDLAKGEQCDDGNHVDHDGCSSLCQTEQARWVDITGPAARYGAVAAYDATRDVVVLQGGSSLSSFDDTWLWRGRWTQPRVATRPEVVTDPALVFDPDLDATIRVGGAGASVSSRVYAWDGANWKRLADGPAVYGHAMAYDSHRHRLVVFGGYTSQDGSKPPSSDTWEWDGITWTKHTTATTPNPRTNAMMTYDPQRGVILMYGGKTGYSNSTVYGDTWTYDGNDWTPGATGPGALYGAALAYDATLQADILFGGFSTTDPAGNGMPNNRTWKWNGSTWTLLSPTTGPTTRGDATLTPDGRGNLVLFGGTGDYFHANPSFISYESWIWDGSNWAISNLAPPLYQFEVTTNTDLHREVIFGGRTTTNSRNTYELTDKKWNATGASGTTASTTPGMVYDPKRHQTVLFGGQIDSSNSSQETWTWSAGTWTKQTPATSPPPRATGQLVYDGDDGVVLAFACIPTASGKANDLWAWDGTTWTELHPAHTPPVRSDEAIGYDPIRHQLVMFGGLGPLVGFVFPSLLDTWVYENGDWRQVTPPTSNADTPSSAYGARVVWNAARGRLTLVETNFLNVWEWDGTWWQQVVIDSELPPRRTDFGATPALDGNGIEVMLGSFDGNRLGDTWQLRWDGPQASDACGAALDNDGDGLAGCNDPDCWVTCTPECAPNTTCPADTPHCGDNVCDAFAETCYTCPKDCACSPVCGNYTCDGGETSASCPGDCP